jgi:glycosyltransferase involved in cell wall biosynthesis
MKQIMIVIPTRNRWEKLQRTLRSIPRTDFIDIVVVCDGDKPTFDVLKNMACKRMLVRDHVGAVRCRNLGIVSCAVDGILYATDDITFEVGAIDAALQTFNEHFPDDDGVVGFVQDLSFHPTGVALVGKTFLDRYPNKQLFCPQYYHFAAQEVLRYCEKLGGKFVQCAEAKVLHYHPNVYKEDLDTTHIEARKFKDKDLSLNLQRIDANVVWPLG